jgi:hypothetical protein
MSIREDIEREFGPEVAEAVKDKIAAAEDAMASYVAVCDAYNALRAKFEAAWVAWHDAIHDVKEAAKAAKKETQ